ncbi:unnamed protein product [Mycena citricolor]|uniref:Cyclase n=1 Tax=Mycena citricolor TaxID=2018698 RepID=A0AAD2HU26_9AGAR|nr:unnamed protein product [Mycena citricolor]
MQVVDLSHPLKPGMQVYPGDPEFAVSSVAAIEKDGYAVCALSLGSHTGTHVDAPAHFFADGLTIEQIPIGMFIGPALVVDLTHKAAREEIKWEDLVQYAPRMKQGTLLLLRTGWSRHWGTPEYFDHPYLSHAAAEKVIECGVRLIGVDSLNPDETRSDDTGVFGVHEVVLGAGGIIAENLTNLELLQDGDYVVHLVPLSISASDGSPVRAFATKVT